MTNRLFNNLSIGVLSLALQLGFAGAVMAVGTQHALASENKLAKKKTKSAGKSSGGKVSFHNGSQESTSERNGRLQRECKGRANSGMCAGFGQGS